MFNLQNSHGDTIDHTFHPGSRTSHLVILAHGLTGNKDRPLLVGLANGLAEKGWPCLRISFSGNGKSGGDFRDSNLTRQIGDLKAILNTIPQQTTIIYSGHSMGGAVGVLTAKDDPRIRVLVSLAGMTYTADFVEREFGNQTPDQSCMWEEEEFPLSSQFVDDMRQYDNTLEAAAAVTQPWLLFHGIADDVVPIKDGRDAYAAAHCEKRLIEIPEAEHPFSEKDYPEMIAAIHAWLEQHC